MRKPKLPILAALVTLGVPASQAEILGLYTFDESATPLDDTSGKNNHLAIGDGNDPVWGATSGFAGTGAYEYSADRLVAPVDINSAVLPKMTWGAWVRTNVISGAGKILGHDDGGWDRTIGLDNRFSNLLRYTTFTGDDPVNNSGPLEGTPVVTSTTDWTFVAAVYDQDAKTVTMYVDMEATTTTDPLVAVTEPAGFGPGNTTFAIGGISPAHNGEPWDGAIDNVFIYDEALTPEKITLIRNRGLNELRGTFSDPRIEVTREATLYGNLSFQTVPATINRTVTIKNLGTANTLTVNAPAIGGPDAPAYSIVSAPTTLAPGASGDVVIALTAGANGGNFLATLTITSNDADSPPVVIPLNARVGRFVSEHLIGLYTFDKADNRDEDSSGLNNHITGNAGTDPVWNGTQGFSGTGAYDFSGDRLIVPIDINVSNLPKMTWGAWVRTDSIVSNLYKVMGHDDGAWDRTIGLDNRFPSEFRYTAFTGTANNSGPVEGTPGPVNTTDWAFIAASYDETIQSMTMFVDIDASTTDDPLVEVTELAGFGPGAPSFAIGGISPANNGESWDGVIDNVFVYKDALTPEKITAIRNRGLRELMEVPAGDPDLALSPASLFGDLRGLGSAPGPVTRSLTISNEGASQALTITGITVTGADAARYNVTSALPGPLAPGGTAAVEVVFTPAAAGGNFTAVLNIASNDEDTPVAAVPLNAQVTSDPEIEVTHGIPLFGRMTFHSLPGAIQRTITVRNAGLTGALTVNAPVISGADAVRFTVVSAPATVAPGAQGAIVISYAPAAEGNFSGLLQLSSSDPDSPGVTVTLDGSVVIVPPATLAAFYSFDSETEPFKDDSGSGNDITDTAGTDPLWDATTGVNASGAFEFSGDRLISPMDVNPGTMPQMSWGAWVRTNTLTSGLYKVLGHDDGAWDRVIGLDNRNPGIFRYTTFTGTANNSGPLEGTPGPLNTEDWTFLAATYDEGTQLVTMYVDLDAGTTGDYPFAVTELAGFGTGFPTFAIGDIRPDVLSEPWNGAIDNVFVYSGILTTDEIKALRDGGKSAAIPPASEFQVTSFQTNANGTVTLKWNSVPGEVYTVHYNFDLSTPVDAWPDDADDVASQGAQTSYTTTTSFTSNRRVFFSVSKN